MPNHKPWSSKEQAALKEAVETMTESELELTFRRSFPHIRKQMVKQGLQFPGHRKLQVERAMRRVQFREHISDRNNLRNFMKTCAYYAKRFHNSHATDDFTQWALEEGLKGNVVNIKMMSIRYFEKKERGVEFKDNIDYEDEK